MPDKKRLLLFELRMLGDATMALPYARAAQELYDVHVCCCDASRSIFEYVLPSDRIHSWTPPWVAERDKYNLKRLLESGIWRLVRQMRGLNCDVAVCSWADPRVHVLMALCGIPTRIAFPATEVNYLGSHLTWRKRQLRMGKALAAIASVALCKRPVNHPLHRRAAGQSHGDDWLQIAKATGVTLDLTAPSLTPDTTASVPEAVQTLVDLSRREGKPLWLVHPGARHPIRQWPLDKLEEALATFFAPRGIPVVIIKPPGEKAPAPQDARQVVVSTANLDAFIRVMACTDAVLCHDSMAAHMAAVLGKPVVTIFGAGSSEWFSPCGNEPSIVAVHGVCPYHPCLDRCHMPSPVCLESVTVDMVLDMLEKVNANLPAGVPPE